MLRSVEEATGLVPFFTLLYPSLKEWDAPSVPTLGTVTVGAPCTSGLWFLQWSQHVKGTPELFLSPNVGPGKLFYPSRLVLDLV